jgi:hypothetical protein
VFVLGNETILDTASKRRSEEDERRRRELKKKDKQKPLREKQTLVAEPRHFGEVAPPLIRSEIGGHVGSNLILSKRSPKIVSTLLPPPQIKIRKIKFILPLCASPAVKGERISAPVLREKPLYKVRLAHIPAPAISSERIERPILSMEQYKIMFSPMTVAQITSHRLGVKSLVRFGTRGEVIPKPVPADPKVSPVPSEASPMSSIAIGTDEEIPELLNLIFSITGGEIDSKKAKVLCVEELQGNSHIGALMTICARIHREKKGGTPVPYQLTHLTDDFKNEIIKWMKAEDKIFLAELKEKDWKKLKESRNDWDYLLDRIKDLYIQNHGFIIFNKRISLDEFPIAHHAINILHIKPQKLDTKLKNGISSMIWGFVDLDEPGTFDHVFDSAKNKFEGQLEMDAEEQPYFTATTEHDGESPEHFEIKVFLVRYLTKVLKLKEHEIQNEIKVEVDYGSVTPDIRVPARSEVYEVETLFGGGDHPINKIKTTINKYDKLPEIKTINIVLDNLTFLRHIVKLRGVKHTYNTRKGWGDANGRSVEFYTLDLQNNSLVSMKQVIKRLKQLQEILDHRERSVGEAEYGDMC